MKKIDWLKIIKISIGCCFAVFLADWLGLRSATSAGIIALLSIQNTKKETLTIAGKRVCAFLSPWRRRTFCSPHWGTTFFLSVSFC